MTHSDSSWKDAFSSWKHDLFAVLPVPSASMRQDVILGWATGYVARLIRVSLGGAGGGAGPREVSPAAMGVVHAQASIALARLVHQVPGPQLLDLLDKTQEMWAQARGIVASTLAPPRFHRADAHPATSSLDGFDSAWPKDLPRPLLDLLLPGDMGSRLVARRDGGVDPAPPRARLRQ